MKTLTQFDCQQISAGSHLSSGEYATIIALSGKTFAETCASVYFAGAAASSIFYLTGASLLGLYGGFSLYHWLAD